MIDKIIKLLKLNKEISGWKLNEEKTESVELFFIKKSLDMNRAKTVKHITLTVYVDFKEDDKTYKGSSSSEIHPTMTIEEIKNTIERLTFGASLVKNAPYPLAKKMNLKPVHSYSNLEKKPLNDWAFEIAKAFYEADKYENGGINSAEFFLNKKATHVINSEGVDVSYEHYSGNIEFITNYKGIGEEIELYKDLNFTNYVPEVIKDEVETMLRKCRDKACAKSTPSLKNIPILFTGSPVKEIFSYYTTQSSASAIYNNISNLKVGENVQGENVLGDSISITLNPSLDNSTLSVPYDGDGFPLSKVELYKNGILNQYWGNVRFSHYLDIAPTGNIGNVVVSCGKKSIKEMKTPPYLELLAFSDFQMDSLTGDFGGEIRLGYYNDGKTIIPVTGGSVSGNIRKLQASMEFSKEFQQDNNFVGPKTILLNDISIAGCDEII